jgi:hypothetical protein
MSALRSLWIALTTGETTLAGTDSDFFLDFGLTGKSIALPNQPGNDTEMPIPNPPVGPLPPFSSSNGTTYLFDVTLDTTEFVPGTVRLRLDVSTSSRDGLPKVPGLIDPTAQWQCRSILMVGLGRDGKVYPISAMPEVNRWLGPDQPGGTSMVIDLIKRSEVGLPAVA